MSLTFNAEEILQMAIQVEKNGQKFYRKAAGLIANPKTKQFLLDLAAMEAQHEKVFTIMKLEITDSEKETNIFDPDNEASLYLQAMADGHVFNAKQDISEKLTGKESVEQIFTMAIQVEKDSIIFYIGLKDYVARFAGQDKVQNVIEEEKKHIVFLNQHLKEYFD
jgi:rubrerythrin